MVGKATPDRGGPRKSPDGVDPKTSGWASKRTRKTQRDGHNSGVKIWSLCSVSSTLSHANLEQPFQTLAIKREVTIIVKKSSCVVCSCIYLSACVCLCCCVVVMLHEHVNDYITVWCDLGLNPGLLDHWQTLYPLGQWAYIYIYIYICVILTFKLFLQCSKFYRLVWSSGRQ